jgi:hypothetical protein
MPSKVTYHKELARLERIEREGVEIDLPLFGASLSINNGVLAPAEKKRTKKEMVLDILLSGRRLDLFVALQEAHTSCPSQYVSQLRADGIQIVGEPVGNESGGYHYEYWMTPEAIELYNGRTQ